MQWISALAAHQNDVGTLKNTYAEAELHTNYIRVLGNGAQALACDSNVQQVWVDLETLVLSCSGRRGSSIVGFPR